MVYENDMKYISKAMQKYPMAGNEKDQFKLLSQPQNDLNYVSGKNIRIAQDVEGNLILIDHFDVVYAVREDGKIICPDDTLLGGRQGLSLHIDEDSGA